MNEIKDISERERLYALLRSWQVNINTALPCIVENVYAETVDVSLTILRSFNGIEQEPLQVLDCPVLFSGSGDYSIRFPINAGDTGLVLFSQRDIDYWLEGKVSLPATVRLHDYSDGIFIPGLRQIETFNIPEAMTIKSGSVTVVLTPDGKVTIDNGKHELLSLLKELVTILTNTTTVPFTGHGSTPRPEDLITKAEFISLLSKLETF